MATELSRTTKVTTDHEEIRRWAEERGGVPAEVVGTERDGEPGILRIAFLGEGTLKPLSWDEWFEKFGDQATAYLLLQLRKTNRRIQRLRAVALAAMEGGPEEIRIALAALKPHDLDR